MSATTVETAAKLAAGLVVVAVGQSIVRSQARSLGLDRVSVLVLGAVVSLALNQLPLAIGAGR